jgi:hypothetical protein
MSCTTLPAPKLAAAYEYPPPRAMRGARSGSGASMKRYRSGRWHTPLADTAPSNETNVAGTRCAFMTSAPRSLSEKPS